ncbi:hypothetical protein [uncultured Rhodospira sp.]|uniref:hypothetical protein n=1 Tax=uncultured Rhodospira sp. TaxID=1936189 RepID=UPI002624AF39|nr:hypothetical protein [uncultured Rhodospira sp.]
MPKKAIVSGGQTVVRDMTAEEIAARVPPTPTEADVRAEGARRLEALASAYTREERETWHQQVAEALAVTADAQASAPLLSARASARGLTVTDMASLVLSRRDAHAVAAGTILAAQDALLAMEPIPSDLRSNAYWPA